MLKETAQYEAECIRKAIKVGKHIHIHIINRCNRFERSFFVNKRESALMNKFSFKCSALRMHKKSEF